MHLSKGKEYFEKGDFQKAREELESAYHLRPQDEKVLNMLGMTYFKMEMLPQAEEMYVALAANNPDVYTLQSNLGLIRLKLEKFDQAEGALTRALELQPANPKAHFYLGLLYEKMENWGKALSHFEYAKADKMVARAKEKLAEGAARKTSATSDVLPFEVLQVLPDEEEEAHVDTQAGAEGPMETVVAPEGIGPQSPAASEDGLRISDAEVAAAEGEWVEHNASTGKMRRRDVMEAMQALEEKETQDEEELVEDEVLEEEGASEEQSTKPWEKTQPTIRTDAEPAPEEQVEAAKADVPAAAPASEPSGFFIPEETAADISTFLAESRQEEEEETETPDFVMEPPQSAMSGEPAAAEEFDEAEELTEESRIPSPEEIENATLDFGAESIFSNEPEEEPAGLSADETARDDAESLFESEEIRAEKLLAGEPEPEAVVESPIVEIPEVEEAEAVLEEAVILEEEPEAIPAPAEEPARLEEVVPASPVSESGEAGEETAVEEVIEHTIPMGQRLQAEPPPREPARVDTLQPANLDQFSRDRFYIQPLIGADRFLLIDPHLLEIIISDRMIVRKGSISSYTGRVSFTGWADESMPLVEVTGSGILFLADRRKEIFVISLNNESIYVESNHLLVAQSVLKVEPFSLQHGDDVFSTVKISGRGTIAITCSTKPLTLNVYESMPANIPADALIAWSGRLNTEVITDENLYRVMMQPGEGGALLRFSGAGDVVVEQGSLWGDRRAQK